MAASRPWDFLVQPGQILTTAIHAGHSIRPEILPWLEIDPVDRLREEDPLTDYFLGVGDSTMRVNRSRFEVDLNRPREKAISTDPEDQWGLTVWNSELPTKHIQKSKQLHDDFYNIIRTHCEEVIAKFGWILIFDVHSYNHRRDGANAAEAPLKTNPDIDLGATTMNHNIYGDLLARFAEDLRSVPVCGRPPEVGINKRWEGGGNFPEWLHSVFGDEACVITLEYKKIFMDEWTGHANILALQHLREGLARAVENACLTLRDI